MRSTTALVWRKLVVIFICVPYGGLLYLDMATLSESNLIVALLSMREFAHVDYAYDRPDSGKGSYANFGKLFLSADT